MEDGEIIAYTEKDKFKLENLATGIKSFALLILLIEKGFIAKNTILILDEPEVHLHPTWQLEYARIIIELVKHGIKVLVTTHSPYMLEMLEVLSKKHKIENSFYLPQESYDGFIFKELKIGHLQPLYNLLSLPYEIIEEETQGIKK